MVFVLIFVVHGVTTALAAALYVFFFWGGFVIFAPVHTHGMLYWPMSMINRKSYEFTWFLIGYTEKPMNLYGF